MLPAQSHVNSTQISPFHSVSESTSISTGRRGAFARDVRELLRRFFELFILLNEDAEIEARGFGVMNFSCPPRPLNPCRKTDDVFAMKLVFFFRIFRCITAGTLLMEVTSDVLMSAAEEILISVDFPLFPNNLDFVVGWEV